MLNYDRQTLAVLIAMIFVGAGRSFGVKIYYQMGLDFPLLLTILFTLGHSLSLPMYFVGKFLCGKEDEGEEGYTEGQALDENNDAEELKQVDSDLAEENGDEDSKQNSSAIESTSAATIALQKQAAWMQLDDDLEAAAAAAITMSERTSALSIDSATTRSDRRPMSPSTLDVSEFSTSSQKRRGSKTGLTEKSAEAVKWVHRVPWWAKPIIPGFFKLTNTICRMMGLLYLSASVAEMMVNGLELVVSVLAAIVIRKRHIPRERWFGVAVVLVGILIVAGADFFEPAATADSAEGSEDENDGKSSSSDIMVGFLFVLGNVFSGVFQDMSEELFMQEADFPAGLLLGLEGLTALLLSLPLYFIAGPYFGEDPSEAFEAVGEKAGYIVYAVFLTLLFYMSGVFQILGIGVTSSMTRNVWKNLRGLVVWTVGIITFYAVGSGSIGEEWTIPASLMILGGFCFIMAGIYVYYGRSEPTPTTQPDDPKSVDPKADDPKADDPKSDAPSS